MMRKNIVLSLTGPDRIGIVEYVTKILLEYDCNVETSRMTRLGGEFAMIMLFTLPLSDEGVLEKFVARLNSQGFKVTAGFTEENYEKRYMNWLPFQINVHGADHEGIVHHVAVYLQKSGINIESMDTFIKPAPMSGTPFFFMDAVVMVPLHIVGSDWIEDLKDVANDLNVEIEIKEGKE
jgi:glycine cleavage system transcriptional repressor